MSRLIAHAPARQLLLLAVTLIATSGIAVLLLLAWMRADALQGGRRLGASFARLLEEQSTRSLQAVEQQLQLAAGAYQALAARGPVDPERGDALLREHVQALAFGSGMWIVGPDGRALHSSNPGNRGLDLSDRPYVRAARERPDGGFRLDQPLRSRADSRWLLVGSVPLRSAQGAPAGVLAAAVAPPLLDDLWRGLGMGERVTVTLLRRDGTLMMHSPFDATLLERPRGGLTIPTLPLDQVPAGEFEKEGAFDGVYRLFSYRVLAARPELVVVVGQPVADLTAAWRLNAWGMGGAWALASLLVGLLCLQLARAALARHEGELVLRANEARLRELLASLRSGVLLHDAQTRIVDANPAACTMLGRPLEALLGLTADDPGWHFLEEDGTPMAEHRLPVRQVLERGTPLEHLLIGLHHPERGETRWGACSASALHDAQGRIDQIVVSITDVTEWRRSQQQTIVAQQELAATLAAIPDLLFEMDLDGRYLRVHTGRADLLAAPAHVLAGRSVSDVLPPEAAAQVLAALSEAHATRNSAGRQYALPLPQGTAWFELSISRATPPGDAAPRFLVLARDISARKRAEHDLQRLNRALRVLGAGNQALLLSAEEQELLDAVCRNVVEAGGCPLAWIGLPEDDAARTVRVAALAGPARGYLDGVHISWDAQVAAGQGPTGHALRTGQPQVNPDVAADESMTPWRERARRHGLRASVALPLTSPQRLIGALMLYAPEPNVFDELTLGPLQELARNVAIAIETLRAQRQRDAANEANQAKSRFLAGISHEIRTPINAILGLTHLLQRDDATPAQAERLQKIARAARHLLSIVNDVLDLSKIEAGGMALREAPFELRAVFDHVHEMIGEAARAKGLQVHTRLEGVPPWLRGDEVRLRQALLNLAANALKFTEHGSITMSARVSDTRDGALQLTLAVQDTGIGVAVADQARIFDAFEQATEVPAGGTGLGLPIVRRLARLMGGEAGVDSRPGQGSLFWFSAWLRPHEAGAVPAAKAPPPLEALETAIAARHAGARVLLAEDNAVNREVVCALLEPLPLRVDCASDGLQAVTMAAAAPYDLVLMDMQMPGVDGPEATRRIRRLPGREALPIVALTANAFDDSRRDCLDAGMNDFLAKPIEPQALCDCLLRWLDARVTAT